jgi:transcriptional regulator with XRE-family HTH domain
MESNRRLRAVRYTLKLRQNEFSEALGLKQGSYSDLERGKNNLSSSVKLLLKEKFNVNIDWLETGSGNMFSEKQSESKIKANDSSIFIERLINQNRILAEEVGSLKERSNVMAEEIERLKKRLSKYES